MAAVYPAGPDPMITTFSTFDFDLDEFAINKDVNLPIR